MKRISEVADAFMERVLSCLCDIFDLIIEVIATCATHCPHFYTYHSNGNSLVIKLPYIIDTVLNFSI
jgi:hypothetical protein